jgi:CO/xanthine dehydrogenase FAD-binding subunit
MFELERPGTVEEVLACLEEHGQGAKILAGGTDLLLQIRSGQQHYRSLVALGGIDGLKGIALEEANGQPVLRIKSCTTIEQIKHSPEVTRLAPALQVAAASIATWQVRNLATLGGNLCNASPAADLAPPLLAMGATMHIAGPSGERQLPIGQFFLGPGRTALTQAELLTSIKVPTPGPRWIIRFLKHSLRAVNDLAVVSLCAALKLSPSGEVEDARIALGAAAPVPVLVQEAAQALIGFRLTDALISKAAELARRSAQPLSDLRGSKEYRYHMVEHLTRDALTGIARQYGSRTRSGNGRGG